MKKIKLHKLFVYGTLLDYSKSNTHYVRAKMWDVGSFPCILLDKNGIAPGQVIDVTEEDLIKLDRYEGVPHLYTREKTKAYALNNMEELDVFVYQWAGSIEGLKEISEWTK